MQNIPLFQLKKYKFYRTTTILCSEKLLIPGIMSKVINETVDYIHKQIPNHDLFR